MEEVNRKNENKGRKIEERVKGEEHEPICVR